MCFSTVQQTSNTFHRVSWYELVVRLSFKTFVTLRLMYFSPVSLFFQSRESKHATMSLPKIWAGRSNNILWFITSKTRVSCVQVKTFDSSGTLIHIKIEDSYLNPRLRHFSIIIRYHFTVWQANIFLYNVQRWRNGFPLLRTTRSRCQSLRQQTGNNKINY